MVLEQPHRHAIACLKCVKWTRKSRKCPPLLFVVDFCSLDTGSLMPMLMHPSLALVHRYRCPLPRPTLWRISWKAGLSTRPQTVTISDYHNRFDSLTRLPWVCEATSTNPGTKSPMRTHWSSVLDWEKIFGLDYLILTHLMVSNISCSVLFYFSLSLSLSILCGVSPWFILLPVMPNMFSHRKETNKSA